jgi:uridine kinase
MNLDPSIPARRSFIVGVAGGSASGKSTFVSALVQALAEGEAPLRAEVVNTDRYFRSREPDGPTIALPSGEGHFDYNRTDSVDNARLAADLDRLSRGDGAPDVLLAEGLMVLYVPEIRERLDLRLFVELEADERALRRLLRDLKRRNPVDLGAGQWIADYYNSSARVGHMRYVEPSRAHADLILRGDADFARTAAMVAAVVRSRVYLNGADGQGAA